MIYSLHFIFKKYIDRRFKFTEFNCYFAYLTPFFEKKVKRISNNVTKKGVVDNKFNTHTKNKEIQLNQTLSTGTKQLTNDYDDILKTS